jgi:hypothetical protein
MNWKFFIDGVQTQNEPANWDSFEYALSMSENHFGVESVFSDTNLTFWPEDSVTLISKFNIAGFDATANFKIQKLCGTDIEDEINGVLNFMQYSESEGAVSIVFDESDFSRKFNNRLDVKVNFSDLKSVDGNDLPDPDYFNLKLHSKAIKKETFFSLTPYCEPPTPPGGAVKEVNYKLKPDLVRDLLGIPTWFNKMTPDIPGSALPALDFATLFDDDDGTQAILDQNPNIAPGYASSFSFRWTGKFKFTPTHNMSVNFTVVHGPNSFYFDATFGSVYYEAKVDLVAGVEVEYDLDVSNSFDLAVGEGIYILLVIDKNDALEDAYLNIKYIEGAFQLTDASFFTRATDSRAIDIFNAFKRVVQNITGQTKCFRSNFFGRPGVFPAPDVVGCGAYVALTNGLNLRNMIDKNGEKFPISMSWNDLYTAADAVWNLGWGIEYDGYGRGFVRVEEAEYFKNNNVTEQFLNVPGITREISSEYLYNSIEIGYTKWNLNSGGLNGIDEFNTKHNYSLAVLNPQNKLSKVCKFIASGYVIELTRREQPSAQANTSGPVLCDTTPVISDPTLGNQIAAGQKDFETDNDLFFICTNKTDIPRSSLPADLYTKPVGSIYKKGTISERNENFDIVGNLISPETAYNLRISPKRNLIRFYSLIAVSLFGKASPRIKFVSGEGNYQEFDKYKIAAYDCDYSGTKEIHQDEDLLPVDVKDPIPIFKPVYISAEVVMTFDQFLNIRSNSEKAIQISCNSSGLITGFIKDLRYKPMKDGGVAQIKILQSVCVNGSFSNGFDNGFDIGTC